MATPALPAPPAPQVLAGPARTALLAYQASSAAEPVSTIDIPEAAILKPAVTPSATVSLARPATITAPTAPTAPEAPQVSYPVMMHAPLWPSASP